MIDAIRAKEGTSALNVTKLLKLSGELNDNYARRNTYASHTLLRGLLDHIPPILGQPHFDAVVSNYRWTKTDKKYLQQLAAFRAQGDDALHRQLRRDASQVQQDRGLEARKRERRRGRADLQQSRHAVGARQPERVVVLGRQPLRGTADTVVRKRDLRRLNRRDRRHAIHGGHSNIVDAL